jgi:hypothetical protein
MPMMTKNRMTTDMHTQLDTAAMDSALDAAHAALVDLESAITEAEQRQARMAAAPPADTDRFSAFATRQAK